MGKQVTVLPGFSYVEAPGPLGPKTYQAGQTIVYTDAEYAALPASITRCISSPTTVPNPVRPAVDTNDVPTNVNATATGAVQLDAGPNVLTLTGNITVAFPTDVANGNATTVQIVAIQDGTGSRTLTLPASAKAPGGTAPVLSTAAASVDYLEYLSVDGGVTWLLVNKQLAIH